MSSGRRPQFNAQEEIKRLILERGLPAGAPMPTEMELMGELGISRGSLREALKSLQARGIIEVRHGSGMFVGHRSMESLLDGLIFHGQLEHQRDDLTTASELVDVRDILESSLVQQVAATASEDLVVELELIVQQMEDAASRGELFQEADRQFHEKLYSRLGNRLVIQLLRTFWEVLEAVRPQLASGISDPATDAQHHRAILESVRRHDQERARQAMVEHFRATHTWIQGRA